MTDQDDPLHAALSAFLDGEISPAEASQIEAELAANGALRAYVARQERLRDDLQRTFAPVLDEPVPATLLAAARGAPLGWRSRWQAQLARWQGSFAWRMAVPAMALALGLVVGIALDRASLLQPATGSGGNGEVLASAPLARVLDERLASDQSPAAPIRIGLSFRNRVGQDCRTFAMAGSASVANGIACHAGANWVVADLTRTTAPAKSEGPYQMAAAAMPDAIRNAVQAMIAGEPFDAGAERAARARGWREPGAH